MVWYDMVWYGMVWFGMDEAGQVIFDTPSFDKLILYVEWIWYVNT